MAQLQDLSNELLLDILDKVSPDDIESVSLASKRIYHLATSRLEEHRRLRKQYARFQNEVEYNQNHWRDPGGLLAHLLCTILTNARIGHYIMEMHLKSWNNSAREGWKPDVVFRPHVGRARNRLQQDSRTSMDIIEEAVRAVGIIPSNDVDDWLHQIRRGNEEPLVALLLLHAPNLHTLRFVAPYTSRQSSYLLKTIQRVAAPSSTNKLYASRLKDVEISFAEDWQSLDFVKAFMSLPSLTSIDTESLFVDGRTHEDSSMILSQPSKVTKMSFHSGNLPETVISELVQGMKHLNSFTYEFQHLWRDEDYRPPFDCPALLNALEANAGDTLEHLELNAEKLETSHIAPARRFHALRDIEIHTSRCFAVDAGKLANMVGSLPISLERFAMRWHEVTSVDSTETLIAAIVDFIRESKTQLPHLKKLDLATGNQEEFEALWDCLVTDDMAQINPRLSFITSGPNGNDEIPAWADNVCTCGEDCFGNGNVCH